MDTLEDRLPNGGRRELLASRRLDGATPFFGTFIFRPSGGRMTDSPHEHSTPGIREEQPAYDEGASSRVACCPADRQSRSEGVKLEGCLLKTCYIISYCLFMLKQI